MERKKIRKKVSQCRKTERGTLWGFTTSIVAKHQKIEGGKSFIFAKNHTVPKKTERRDALGFSNIHSDAKQQKIEEGKSSIFGKNHTVPKKTERRDALGFSNIHSDAKQQKK